MPLSAGARLGPYEILGPIGQGGMGEVYRARDSNLNREVAIKVLPAVLANDADYLAVCDPFSGWPLDGLCLGRVRAA